VGLLLAKFLRRSGEIGVRRALGAPRKAIYLQFLTEAGMVGLAGGVLGLALTLLVAVVATVLAGLYPTFRASRVQPAWQLKSN
jgi:putative ABC transport system permease protein